MVGELEAEFRFHTGSIKSQQRVADYALVKESFDSILVRLKVTPMWSART